MPGARGAVEAEEAAAGGGGEFVADSGYAG